MRTTYRLNCLQGGRKSRSTAAFNSCLTVSFLLQITFYAVSRYTSCTYTKTREIADYGTCVVLIVWSGLSDQGRPYMYLFFSNYLVSYVSAHPLDVCNSVRAETLYDLRVRCVV
jgi:hypothetical protein